MKILHLLLSTVTALSLGTAGCDDPHDADGDGHVADDCAPDDAHVYPGAPETPYDGIDQDCDDLDLIDVDGDGAAGPLAGGDDCDDTDPSVSPHAIEIPYDGIDQDCRAGDLVDLDGDSFASTQVAGGTDCDDADATIHPGAIEVADQRDQDCDTIVDEETEQFDDDGDGYAEVDGDCNDFRADIHPGAPEIPGNLIDEDCTGGDLVDLDHDGFPGVAFGGPDCRDDDPQIHPGAIELPDGIDQDCDGVIDELTERFDDDEDGYTEAGGDCNDFRADIHPGAPEIPGNLIDEDCTGGDLVDLDGDAFTGEQFGGPDCDDHDPAIHPGAAELPDHVDNNCSGVVDEHTVLYDDDLDGASESTGDCNDYNPAIHPGAHEEINGLDDDCDGAVDEPTLALAPAAVDSLMAATASGPLSSTPGDIVYRPPGFLTMAVRYTVVGPGGENRDVVDVLARPPLPPRYGFAGAPVRAFTLTDGTVRWIVDGGPVPSGAAPIGEVEIAQRVPFAVPLEAGDRVERRYVGRDGQGHEAVLATASLTIAAAPPPLLQESVVPLDVHGNAVVSRDLAGFGEGDLLFLSDQEQWASTEDDWAYDCVPRPRAGGGVRLECRSDYDDSNGKTMLARVWRVAAPLRVRCVTPEGGTASCAVPPTITVANDQRWSALVECPVGFRCMTVVSPLGEWTSTDDDFGWTINVQAIDPLRDLGLDGIAGAAGPLVPAGYIAGMHGDVVELAARGGNSGSYARFIVGQLLIPLGLPVETASRTFRTVDPHGMTVPRALCLPSPAPAIVAPVLAAYDPHYEPGPSLLSRIGTVIERTADLGQDSWEMAVNPGIGGGVSLVKSIYGFVTALFGLGDPHEDDAALTRLEATANPADPTCVDLTTVMRFISDGAPAVEHAVTLYSVFEAP